MGMTKLSIMLEDDLVDELRERTGTRGISDFIDQAVRHELQLGCLASLLADLEDELGLPDDDMVAEAFRSLDRIEQ